VQHFLVPGAGLAGKYCFSKIGVFVTRKAALWTHKEDFRQKDKNKKIPDLSIGRLIGVVSNADLCGVRKES
jgi:hypothetical protein